MVEIIVKKTIELSLEEKKKLIVLFNFIFDKARSIVDFDNQYLNNSKGYSYHVCLIDNGEIVGSLSSIPNDYIINGVKLVFVINVDAMILKKYRDFFYYYDMYMAIDEFAIKDGAVLSYSFPNDDSNPLVLKAKIQYTIGKLKTYCIPYRIGGIKSKLRFLNFVSISFSWVWIYVISIISNKNEASFSIEKEIESFNESRYKRMDANYSVVRENKLWFVYKLINYEGIRTVFLIDVAVKSANNFNKAIRFIFRKHHSEFDILLYVGHLPFGRTGLIRVPPKYEPKNFNFAAKIFDKSKCNKSDIFNINNWDVNLSNTDLI